MSISIKSKIPLFFLICVSIGWAFYYQSNSRLNDFGNASFEWLYLLDVFIALPVLCFVCINDKKVALIKAMLLACLAILIGSYIVPEQNKLVWHYLENGRYLLLAVAIVLEVVAILTVYVAIKSALYRQDDPDLSIERPINRFLGESPIAQLLTFETRMWTYVFFSGRIKPQNFSGEQHFTYHQKDGAQSNLLGFVLLIAFELPIMHLLLHFLWSPFAANIVTLLTLFSLAFFFAEYRAFSRRPISLVGKTLVIRYGIYNSLVIPLENIARISENIDFIKRSRFVKRYNHSGVPNIAIDIVKPLGTVNKVFVGVDAADLFMTSVQEARKNLTVAR